MKSVLITGAAGFIGSSLADRLLERGDRVIAVDDFNAFYDPQIKRKNIAEALIYPNYTLYEADICDETRVRVIFDSESPDVVVHLAARAGVRPSIEEPNLYHRVNVMGSQHILDACRTFKPTHVVFASSSSVYGGSTRVPFIEDDPVSGPISPYAATKRMNELQAHVYSHLYGMKVSLFRFFTVYGPRQRPDMAIHKFARLIDQGKPVPMFGDGSSRRDYTYIDDVVYGLIQAVDTPFRYEIFNFGENSTTSLKDLIALLAKHLGKEPVIEQLPDQPGDVPITYANIDKAKRLLGYNPQFSLDEGIRRFVEWYREL
ncbi:MAG: GDP-mannose 4,6-dehydratase [Candidatus Hydrogenedentes bacterium]|nr:GDP-mannose 4,6-dehydratase [Candidatus Hydrogenedentota bacterium]